MSATSDQPMQDIRPTVWIGKQGCTDELIQEISGQLKNRRIIKVKWLQNVMVEPGTIASRAGAILIEVRGRTMILARKGT